MDDVAERRQLAAAVPESRIEKPGIVGPQLAAGCFEGNHLGGIARGNANPFFRCKNVEFLRFQEEAVLAVSIQRFPKIECRIVADL